MKKVGMLCAAATWAVITVLVTGCSFGVEIQYHGRTGVSNTTATGLIAKKTIKDKEDY